jgi:hypothetical protein
MTNELVNNTDDYLDKSCNVLCSTSLAEAANAHFYPDAINLDEDIEELAVKVVEIETIQGGYNE